MSKKWMEEETREPAEGGSDERSWIRTPEVAVARCCVTRTSRKRLEEERKVPPEDAEVQDMEQKAKQVAKLCRADSSSQWDMIFGRWCLGIQFRLTCLRGIWQRIKVPCRAIEVSGSTPISCLRRCCPGHCWTWLSI